MLVIGLTGGIGCGKTIASDYFSSLGVPVIDTDVISRSLVSSGSPLLNEITKYFGKEILLQDSSLNRSKLRSKIFANSDDKKHLESLMHPAIREQVNKQLNKLSSEAYAIVVIPLLIETNQQNSFDRILVIDCSEEKQISRISQRDPNSSSDEILKIIHSQVSRESRLQKADDIVQNNNDLDGFYHELEQLHKKYSSLGI